MRFVCYAFYFCQYSIEFNEIFNFWLCFSLNRVAKVAYLLSSHRDFGKINNKRTLFNAIQLGRLHATINLLVIYYCSLSNGTNSLYYYFQCYRMVYRQFEMTFYLLRSLEIHTPFFLTRFKILHEKFPFFKFRVHSSIANC